MSNILRQLAKSMLSDFRDRWGDDDFTVFDSAIRRSKFQRQKGIHPLICLCTALDPRFKHLPGIPNIDNQQMVWDVILQKMMALLNYSDNSSEQYNNNNEYNFEDETRIKEPNDTDKYLIEMLELDETTIDGVSDIREGNSNEFSCIEELKLYRNQEILPLKVKGGDGYSNPLLWWKN